LDSEKPVVKEIVPRVEEQKPLNHDAKVWLKVRLKQRFGVGATEALDAMAEADDNAEAAASKLLPHVADGGASPIRLNNTLSEPLENKAESIQHVGQTNNTDAKAGKGMALCGVVGIGSRKMTQEMCNGKYTLSPNNETINGAPLWVHVEGFHYIYRMSSGRWAATNDRTHFAKDTGIVRSESLRAQTPIDTKRWEVYGSTIWFNKWTLAKGASVIAITDARAVLPQPFSSTFNEATVPSTIEGLIAETMQTATADEALQVCKCLDFEV